MTTAMQAAWDAAIEAAADKLRPQLAEVFSIGKTSAGPDDDDPPRHSSRPDCGVTDDRH